MPKRHQNDPAREVSGHNNPKKTTTITTGTPKKKETYEEEAAEHKNPAKVAQHSTVHPAHEPIHVEHEADSRRLEEEGEQRSGSDSNAHKHRKGDRLHEDHSDQNSPRHVQEGDEFIEQLEENYFAGENHGLRGPAPVEFARTAYDIKDLYPFLGDLHNDELKNIGFVPEGTRLEQGATYLDLANRDAGDFEARADIIAEKGHYYVPKKDIGYVLWNRLIGVTNPARLDES